MIVGLVALFTVLFSGGTQEYFFVENLEKGVKKYVVEKDRSKEILLDLNETKSTIKAFNKERKGNLSEFLSMNLDRNVSQKDLDDFFENRVEERLILQENIIRQRVEMVSKINDEEWNEIIDLSDASVEKKNAKLEKKGAKDPFELLIKTINSNISDQTNKDQAISLVKNFKERYVRLLDEVNTVNSIESNLLRDKKTSKKEFQKLAYDMNQLRDIAYRNFIDLHFGMKEKTNETEWTKVMRSINKVIL